MFYLNVPYAEKNSASSLGAKWDGEKKKWYVPPEIDLEFFKKWISQNDMPEALSIIESQKPEKGMKLSNLLTKVKQAIEGNMSGTYWINAEIANIQLSGGSLYLQLAETDSKGKQICNNRAVIWGQTLPWIKKKFKLETGQDFQKGIKVLLKVKIEYTIKYQLSIVVLDVDPQFTLGGIEAKIKEIRDKITVLGLYDKNKKLKLPEYYKKIAVVSPQDAAGLGDFKADADKLEENGICKFNYYTAVFQGEKTNKSVTTAIKQASYDALENDYDAIVVIRGGGAKTDLHFLNEFDIVKEIADASVPVMVGVGHERDRVLLDEICNRSFDTPSKVIAHISNNNVNFTKQIINNYNDAMLLQEKIVKQYKTDIESSSMAIMSSAENVFLRTKESINFSANKVNELALIQKSDFKIKLEELNSAFSMKSITLIKQTQSNLEYLCNNIENEKKNVFFNYKTNLNIAASEITMRSPLNALDNGYAIIKNKTGDILTTVKDVSKEKEIIVMMKDGEKEFKTGE